MKSLAVEFRRIDLAALEHALALETRRPIDLFFIGFHSHHEMDRLARHHDDLDGLVRVVRTHRTLVHSMRFRSWVPERSICRLVAAASCLKLLDCDDRNQPLAISHEGATAILQAAPPCLEELRIQISNPNLLQVQHQPMTLISLRLTRFPNLARISVTHGTAFGEAMSMLQNCFELSVQTFFKGEIVSMKLLHEEMGEQALRQLWHEEGLTEGAEEILPSITQFVDQLPCQCASLSLTLYPCRAPLFSDWDASRAFVDTALSREQQPGVTRLSDLVLMAVGTTPEVAAYIYKSSQQHTLRLEDVGLLQAGDPLDCLLESLPTMNVKRLLIRDVPPRTPDARLADTRHLWDDTEWARLLAALSLNTTIVQASFYIFLQGTDNFRSPHQKRISEIMTRNKHIAKVRKLTSTMNVAIWLQALADVNVRMYGSTAAFMIVRSQLLGWLQERGAKEKRGAGDCAPHQHPSVIPAMHHVDFREAGIAGIERLLALETRRPCCTPMSVYFLHPPHRDEVDTFVDVALRTHPALVQGLNFHSSVRVRMICRLVAAASCLRRLECGVRTLEEGAAILQAAPPCLAELSIGITNQYLVDPDEQSIHARLTRFPNLAEISLAYGGAFRTVVSVLRNFTDISVGTFFKGQSISMKLLFVSGLNSLNRRREGWNSRQLRREGLTDTMRFITQFVDLLPCQCASLSLTLYPCRAPLFLDWDASRAFVDTALPRDQQPRGKCLSELVLMEVGTTPKLTAYIYMSLQQQDILLNTLRLEDVGILQQGYPLNTLLKSLPKMKVRRLLIRDAARHTEDVDARRLWDDSEWSRVLAALWQNTTIVEASFYICLRHTDNIANPNQRRISQITTRNQHIAKVRKLTRTMSVETWLQTLAHVNARAYGSTAAYMILQSRLLLPWLQEKKVTKQVSKQFAVGDALLSMIREPLQWLSVWDGSSRSSRPTIANHL